MNIGLPPLNSTMMFTLKIVKVSHRLLHCFESGANMFLIIVLFSFPNNVVSQIIDEMQHLNKQEHYDFENSDHKEPEAEQDGDEEIQISQEEDSTRMSALYAEHEHDEALPEQIVADTLNIIEKKDASCSPIPFLMEQYTRNSQQISENPDKCLNCSNLSIKQNSKTFSSFKFYTSIALSGLLAIFVAVSQFTPEIEKTYSRPPPI